MNPVYVYLEKGAGVKLSIKTLSKRLNLKKRVILYYFHKDPRIRKVKGFEVGTGMCKINVFTIET